MKVRTRFAPSPTGYLHIGNIRTALYSWLFARHNKGEFILRIEDSDTKRSNPKAVKSIIDGMNWLKLEWDEGPYFQTNRLDRYNAVIDEMLVTGTAYKCYCSKERLYTLRKKQLANKEKPHYDSHCRYDFVERATNKPFVVRFANPKNGSVIFNDQIHGLIEFSNQELDDLIIRRADGSPTYNFCVVIDDWDMEITHVIRGEDHINNTPRQINILKALNAPMLVYAHIPMIKSNDGKKLSKRHGSNSVMQYRDDGYLPEALLNHIVRLGWSNGNQEIFNREEMINLFSLKAVSKSSSTFNVDKLIWLNHYYIKTLSPEYIATHLQWHIKRTKINTLSGPEPVVLVKLLSERCKTLKEIVESCRYFYEEFDVFNTGVAKKYLCSIAKHPLELVRDKLTAIGEWTEKNVHHAIKEASDELKIGMSKIGMPLRVAVTGTDQSPALNKVIHAIGKTRSIIRINKALCFITNNKTFTQ